MQRGLHKGGRSPSSIISRPKKSNGRRLDAWILEEVSYETLVLQTRSVSFWGSLVQNARFGDLTQWILQDVSYEMLALQTWRVTLGAGLVRTLVLETRRLTFGDFSSSAPQELSYRVLRECHARVSRKSVLQECPTRVSVLQEFPTSVPEECPTRVTYKSVVQECLTRVSYKSASQERASYKSFPPVCPKSVPQEWPTRVSR